MKKLLFLALAAVFFASSVFVYADEMDFSDVAEDYQYLDAVEYLFDHNVINGYDDDTFRPENDINRAEFLKVLIHAKVGLPDELVYKDCFNDVMDDWFAPYVCYGKEMGFVKGYDGNLFKPTQTVSRAEALKMILEVNEADLEDVVDGEDWFLQYVDTAVALNILDEGASFDDGETMKRGNVSDLLFTSLTYGALAPEKERFIEATVDVTCMVFAADDLLDPQMEEDVKTMFAAYGFDVENEELMNEITAKYEDDEDIQADVEEALKECDAFNNLIVDITEVHNGLVDKMDAVLALQEAYYQVYLVFDENTDEEILEDAFLDFSSAITELDDYYSVTIFDVTQQSFIDGYYDDYEPLANEYILFAKAFVEDVVTEGYDFDEMYDDLVVLDQYYLDFIDAHNALIGIINLQADE
jgi:hypothetical protein